MALKAVGWNVDDFNHTAYPIITTSLVSDQRDYSFTYDEDSNLILAIHKVLIKNSAGIFVEIKRKDQQSTDSNESPVGFWDGNDTTGTPIYYDKTANGIFLDPIPSYSSTGGLKLYIDREPSFLTASDTTKVPGIDGLCHDYLYLKPAYEYARDKNLASAERLYRDLQDARKKVDDRYATKERDIIKRMVANVEDCH